ncbi:hypothetical protein QR680_016393 [Steinernema hermaphroditum]|uniref:Acyltransferase n=1 Tax=Steinernema hermaphroditum TaxID=289476 RepID=A0AA39LMD8_9BILA|nr:hypothetical protein QR680_016393 [Steinernema hermaphroditum]
MYLAPLNVPLHRRIETFCVLLFLSKFFGTALLSVLVPVYLIFFTPHWWLVGLYIVWYLYDYDTPYQGSRPYEWFRNLSLWTKTAEYFPAKLIKTSELSPKHNYIVGSHPHGIMSCGIILSWATGATGFTDIFPGISRRLVTLDINLLLPIRREFCMWMGFIPASREAITHNLNGETKGNAVAIVIGGAEEALDSNADNFNLTLKNRKGFVRIALETGSHLVPLYNFGETSLYTQISNNRGSLLRALQHAFKRICKFSPPIIHGRGIFNYCFGFMPYRVPIATVVGAPIVVDKVENPTTEQIDALHKKYCEALTQLFDTHKTKYGITKETKLNFV